jgi:hypothetical protein
MRRQGSAWLLLFIVSFSAICSAAWQPAAGEQFLGTWTGTWDGAGAGGGFEVTLEKGTDGAVSGKVSVTGEPTYKAPFKALSFDGKKMTAKYDFPPDQGGAVVLEAVFEGTTATGTWSLRQKSNDTEVAKGGWKVTKK